MNKFVRNSEVLKSILKKTESHQLICTKPVRVHIPHRFVQKGLAEVGVETYAYGFLAIINEHNEYTVMKLHSMLKLKPFKTLIVNINDEPYYEFYFEAGDVVIESTRVIISTNNVFTMFEEFLFLGNIPWYLNYDDVGKLFDTAPKYAGSKVGSNKIISEVLGMLIARNPDNRDQIYRVYVNDSSNVKEPAFIPMKSVLYSATNTVDKLTGAYMKDGIVSALTNPTQQNEKIEVLLRA